MKSRQLPKWKKPFNTNSEKLPKLKLYNSLTNQKELFTPKDEVVQWYSCGPTVYDVAHMGHARTYISIDILRRVLSDYFGYKINFVMNITDIDDKIIKRARQNYLLEEYLRELNNPIQIKNDVNSSLEFVKSKFAKENDADKKTMISKEIETIEKILTKDNLCETDLRIISDGLSDYLDSIKGASVVENSIFEKLPRHFEQEFHKDMENLNILSPDCLTRVSEYVEKIVDYVEVIIEKGLAYATSDGSVYFDTNKFDTSDEFYYAKLVPTAYGNQELLDEGEGMLSNKLVSEKRAATDFALWKASKPGEPSWPSPWGQGRPGWHIECSAMASDVCGATLDLHTGGIDLKFPHHDNELAQAEAYHSSEQWVNYFCHTGHLTIAGCKMSKSLKNFISIRDALSAYSWRQLRFAFLLSSWKDTLDYSNDTMIASCAYEKMLLHFYFTVRHSLRVRERGLVDAANVVPNPQLIDQLSLSKDRIHEALCDNIDTREVLSVIRDLVGVAQAYYTGQGATKVDADVLGEVGRYIMGIMRTFGATKSTVESMDIIDYTDEELEKVRKGIELVGREFVEEIKSCGYTGSVVDEYLEEIESGKMSLEQQMDRLGEVRQKLRLEGISSKNKEMLKLCDVIRDVKLADLGVKLQDNDDGIPSVGLLPLWAMDTKKEKQPVSNKNKGDSNKSCKTDKSVDPLIMFQVGVYEGQFSRYDDKGVPTHDNQGEELSKSRRKNMLKEQTVHTKLYNKFLAESN